MEASKPFRLEFSVKVFLFALVALGLLGWRLLYVEDANRAWLNFLVVVAVFLGFGLCGLFFTAIQFLTSARWSVVLRRVMEAMALTIPAAALLFIPIFFGIHSIYEWSHSEKVANDALLLWKSGYLSEGFFILRIVGYFLIWGFCTVALVRNSLVQDRTGDPSLTIKNFKLSALTLVLYALSVTMGAFDILMSVEPHWFSTIFGIYYFAGFFQAGLAMIYILTWLGVRSGALAGMVSKDHFHDIGRFLFGFSVFWAYIAFSQFILIWYGNLPEETFIYRDRFQNGWEWLSAAILVIRFVIPFFILLPFAAKRCHAIVLSVAVLVLFGQWLDLYWFVMPSLRLMNESATAFAMSWQELAMGLGSLGLFVLVVSFVMERLPMVPRRDPRLEESVHYYHHG